MSIKLARIDNRLLHGVTATQWAPKLGVDRVMIIDDEVANNPMLKDSMKLARPAGMLISIITYETAMNNLKVNKYGKESIYILTKKIQTLLNLVNEANIELNEINYGATAQRADAPGLIQINKFVAMDVEEKDIIEKLKAKGSHVFAQYLIKDES
ncbi:MAG: PTS sugar transporter subunit IIB, partial [Erysipelotrichaceae bacterium]